MESELIDPGGDDATRAFNEVRDRLAGLTRAVDSMAGEWKALVIPDYQPTLEKMADTLAANGETLDALSEMCQDFRSRSMCCHCARSSSVFRAPVRSKRPMMFWS